MKTKIILIAAIGLLFGSCTVSHVFTDNQDLQYLPTSKDSIEVFTSHEIDRSFLVLGEVIASVDDIAGANLPVKYLKKEAAKMGADGIINLRLEIGQGYLGSAIQAKGTAIKYLNK